MPLYSTPTGSYGSRPVAPQSIGADLAAPDDASDPIAEKLLNNRLPGPVAAAGLKVDEYTAFEQRATKAFPDLAIEVGICTKRDVVRGWLARRYVLRVAGQSIGAAKLEIIGADIEGTIGDMIRKVAPLRREVSQAREEAARNRRGATICFGCREASGSNPGTCGECADTVFERSLKAA